MPYLRTITGTGTRYTGVRVYIILMHDTALPGKRSSSRFPAVVHTAERRPCSFQQNTLCRWKYQHTAVAQQSPLLPQRLQLPSQCNAMLCTTTTTTPTPPPPVGHLTRTLASWSPDSTSNGPTRHPHSLRKVLHPAASSAPLPSASSPDPSSITSETAARRLVSMSGGAWPSLGRGTIGKIMALPCGFFRPKEGAGVLVSLAECTQQSQDSDRGCLLCARLIARPVLRQVSWSATRWVQGGLCLPRTTRKMKRLPGVITPHHRWKPST